MISWTVSRLVSSLASKVLIVSIIPFNTLPWYADKGLLVEVSVNTFFTSS